MNIETLNSRYGAPGRIVFHTGHAGYPNVVLANHYGAAEVALLGGNVVSYRPTGHAETIFRPAKRDYNRGESFHGGIPVCWPQFGNRFSKDLPQHGFARLLVFDVRGTSYSEEETEITLGLCANDETRALWPHDFDLELKISISMKLNLTLTTRNTGDAPFDFSCGFHPYLSVRERDGVVAKGFDGLTAFDADHDTEAVQVGDLALNTEKDHVFTLPSAPKYEFALLDGGLRRALAVAAHGCARTVVWNPGPEGKIADFKPDDWRRFVCVEPVSDWPGGRTLAPGESHVLAAAIQSTLEGAAQ